MTSCFVWLLILAFAIAAIISMLRWFEQTMEAVENRWWNKLIVLIVMPFMVWLYPSRVSAGRPTAVPRHEPVRGFGISGGASASASPPPPADQPPPGTPKEFLGPPVIPPKKTAQRAGPDPDKLAKLKQKLREQGMLDEEQ